ncbi:MarR family transcriptional regulator [Staphylococcus sp. AS1337]|uniref:MarR family transcriptional regulator n=1 Tax=Staphylococcus sp. AS1337 TaxID=3434042 RepID=UPI003F56D892
MDKIEQFNVNSKELLNKIEWLEKFKLQAALKGYTPSEVHCIEAIEKTKNPNVIKLASSLYLTRGAISKLTKKLIEKELIESYKERNNKKEVYFKLTSRGKEIYEIHEKLNEEFRERDNIVFEQLTEVQFNYVLDFQEKYLKHLDEEIKKMV